MDANISSNDKENKSCEFITEYLGKLAIPENERKGITSLFKNIVTLQKTKGLTDDILMFASVSVELLKKEFNVFDITKIISCALKIMHKIKDAHPVLSVLYVVVVAGMAISNKKVDKPSIKAIMKSLLEENSDEELIKDCSGLEFELLHSAEYLCAIGARKLAEHEVSSLAAEVPFREGLKTMGKLAKRISELQQLRIQNDCDNKPLEYERLMRFICAYCSLATMKSGLLLHHYFLLQLSGNSPSLVNGVKAAIESQIECSKNLLEFLVRPTQETAIVHHFGDISKEKIPLQYLEAFDLKPKDLNHLCDGVYIMSCVAYEESKIFIGELLKQSKWGKTDRGAQNQLTFKKASGDNVFHIHSYHFQDRHLEGGLWVSFGKGKEGKPSDTIGTWKIVPVFGIDDDSRICYTLSPKGSKDGRLLYAKSNGKLCVNKITTEEYNEKQAFWIIKQVQTDATPKSDNYSETESQLNTDTNSDTNANLSTATSPKTNDNLGTDTNSDTNANLSTNTNLDTNANLSPDTNSDTSANLSTKPNPNNDKCTCRNNDSNAPHLLSFQKVQESDC